MSRPKANVYQRVAAQQTMIVVLYGYVQGRIAENNNLSVWQCICDFAAINDTDTDNSTLYQQYKNYAATIREFMRDKDNIRYE